MTQEAKYFLISQYLFLGQFSQVLLSGQMNLGKAMNNMSEYLQYLTNKNNDFQNDNGIDLLGLRDGE